MNFILTETQISELKNKLKESSETISKDETPLVVYSAIFVDPNSLIEKYKPIHENIFADHSTIAFKPSDISDLPIGEKLKLKITGRLTTEKVDVLLVENAYSKNKYPHITLSTAKDVKPYESSSEIENNLGKIEKLNDSIDGIVGVFTNSGVITEDINIPVNRGDTILMGKFKNKKTVVKDIDKDEYNMPTINGKKATTFRIAEDDVLTEVSETDVDLSSFEPQKELNDKIWKTSDRINPKVRVRLLKIADDFIDSIKINSSLCEDIIFVGSLANYNWSKYSDIDLHLVIDFKKISDDIELVKDYFDSKRSIWNDEHENLTIYGFPVEVYIQDLNEDNASNGVYSLDKNKWIKMPDRDSINIADPNKIKMKSADLMTKIDNLVDKFNSGKSSYNIEDISTKAKLLFDKVKKIRKSGLESKENESSIGNIIFKVLRRSGYIEKLVDLKREAYDKINTIK